MKAKQYSTKPNPTLVVLFLLSFILGLSSIYAQCPTVTSSNQSFCDLESILVSDLTALDNGNGVVWYESATSTVPLSNLASLIDGEDYYADDNSGTCGARARVDVTIYNAPIGQNFQGVCLDDPSLATVADLVAVGNDVQWYLTASGGLPLNSSTVLIDDTIYYADQANPDTGCRTSRLSVLVNVGFTPVPTGEMIQEFCFSSQFTPTIADLVASGNNNWYISLFSALPLPETTPLVNGQTYYATTTDPPCESTGRFAVLAILTNGPDPGTNGILDLCDTDTSTVDLFTILGGSPEPGGIWSPTLNSGTGVYDPNIDPEGTYTYTVSSVNTCPDDSSTVTVTIFQEPNAGSNGAIDLCSDNDSIDLFDSLTGTPEIGGTWSPALTSGTGIFDPSIDISGVYTYTVSGIAPCNDATATVTVSVTPLLDAGENGVIEICNTNGSIDLFNSLGGSPDAGGTWSPALTSGTGIFDPLIDLDGEYTYSFTGNAPCPDNSATVTVTVNELSDTGTNATLELCSNDTTIIDLFDNLGGTPDTGGTWSPALISGSGIFNPALDSQGTYTYTITGMTPCPDVSSSVNVIIVPEPNAGIEGTLEICDNNGTIDLFDSLGGTPDAGGTWSPALTSGTGVFDPTIDSDGIYTYTVLGTTPCSDASETVTVTVTPFISAGLNGNIELCSNDSTVDLFDSLNGTPATGGIWSPALISGTGLFDPSIDSEGTYTYTIPGSGPCSDNSATVVVTIEIAPDAGTDGVLELCDTTNTADLFDSLGGMPELGGTWSPSLASGTGIFDPNTDSEGIYTYTISSTCGDSSATVTVSIADQIDPGSNGAIELCITGTAVDLFDSIQGTPDLGGTWSPALTSGAGIFDPNVDTAGTYTYTIESNLSSCPNASVNVIVTIIGEPNAGTDGTLNLCGSTNAVDLFDSLAGMPEIGGTWSPALTSGTGIFDPNVDLEGAYTYTVTNLCGSSSAIVTVSFTDLNNAGNNGTLDICTDDSAVDLFNSLGGTPQPGGFWSPTLNSGTGVFDPNIDASGTYVYTLFSGEGSLCPDDSANVIVSVLEQPDAGSDSTLNLCNATNLVDLYDSLAGTPDTGGNWSPALASGTGVFDPNVDLEGVYTYSVNNICGNSSATVTVSFSDLNDAGVDGSVDFCINDSPLDLFDSLGGTPQTGGVWSPALNSGTGVFDPSIDLAGVYTYTISNEGSLCPDDSASVTVAFIPVRSAGNDGNLDLCFDDINPIDLFDSLEGTPNTGGIWSPALNSGTGIFDPTIDIPGIYTYTVTTPGCNISDDSTVTVTIGNTPDVSGMILSIDDIICFANDIVVNIDGASQLTDGDYTIVYELNGTNMSSNSITISVTSGSSSFTIPQNLFPNTGLSILTISEFYFVGEFCSADTSIIDTIEIIIPDIPTPQISDDGADFCEFDDPTVASLTENIISSGTIIWYNQPNGGVVYSETDMLQDGVTYYAALQSESGCESTIRLAVTVNFIDCVLELIIPDGFSPNGDSINDDFHIVNLNELYPNFKLSIYNRYGNILYEGGIAANRWDGTSKKNNKILPVGVYFYILEFNDGTRSPLQGRVYLSR